MDQVLNALKCANCREILLTPVFLPCGHTICKSHTEVDDEQIICADCGSRHPNKGFLVNEVAAKMIKAQLSKFNFGHQHNEASKSCENLKKQLDMDDNILNDLDYFIHETIGELKNRVLLRSEQLKFKIDEITQELIVDLNEYEKRCKIKCGNKSNTKKFVSLFNEMKNLNEKAKGSWKDWSTVLNELNVDVEKWSKIKEESDSMLENICEKLIYFKEEVFMKKLDLQKMQIEYFEKSNIYPVLIKKIVIYSKILDSALSAKFFELCNFNFDHQEFNLLYRGSRDGFRAADFHSKCDNRANTVTVIKTTSGFIFGGYTQASWTSNSDYGLDANAYLFSLINPFKKPFTCGIHPSHLAIYNFPSYGPTFGAGSDIFICDNSNTTANSCGILQYYQKPSDIFSPNGFYFCDNRNFMVKEIEVFQIINI